MAKCVCSISSDSASGSGAGGGSSSHGGGHGASKSSSISGLLRLSQVSEDAPTVIEGEVRGLEKGTKHAMSIHAYGDLSHGSTSCGPIFNPFGKNHGAPEDEERMVGDLGNIVVGDDGKCTVKIEDNTLIKLIGPHSVIGRAVVIHAGEDDCGRGGHETSLTTGNSGARIASGVIGISSA